MARFHGSTCRCYLGGRDISGDVSDITLSSEVTAHEVTTFASAGAHEFDPGLRLWSLDISGFYDPAVAGFGRQLETLLGANGGIFSIYEGQANAIGERGVLSPDSILDKRAQPIQVADLIKLSGSFKPSAPTGGARSGLFAALLHVLGAETGSGTSASVNNGALTSLGGRANLHITAATGAGVIRVEDSADNSSFLTIATFASASAPGAQTIDIAGTIRQYTRAGWVNGANSLTFALGIARYA